MDAPDLGRLISLGDANRLGRILDELVGSASSLGGGPPMPNIHRDISVAFIVSPLVSAASI